MPNELPAPKTPLLLPPPERPRRARRVLWILGIIVATITAFIVWRVVARPKPERQRPAVPVGVAPARKEDFNVYLTALGSVNAWNTVTVRSRVDGQLMTVNFVEGQRVKAGDVLAEIDPRQFQAALEQAQGQLAKDQAQLENAKRDVQRYEDAREAVTQQQLGNARATAAGAEGTVKADQAAVDTDQLNLSYTHITAPISGVAGLRTVDAGNIIHSSDTNGLVVLTQDRPIAVVFSLPEDNLPQIRKAQAAGQPLTVDAYDSGMSTIVESGEVAAIDNQIDVTTGTVKVKAQFANEKGELFPNQFVNVRLLVDVRKDTTLVPSSSVQIGPQNRFVFVVKADKTVEQRVVTVGHIDGDTTEITKGVEPGEVVVTEGLDKLRDGATVTLQSAPGAGTGEKGTPAKPARKGGQSEKKRP